jgi:lipopolysaccharide/colanic/teichoic acid biosynthesis glycosyltransferase
MENALRIVYIGNTPEAISTLRAEKRISLTVQANVLAAENYLKSGQIPDAIFCEMTISGGDGLAMHEWVRKKSELAGVAFILFDQGFDAELYKKAIKIRVDDFYIFPLPPLQGLLDRLLFLKEYRQKLKPIEPELNREIAYTMPASKRVFDVFAVSAGVIVLSPLLLIVMIAIKLESRGKVLHVTKRIGTAGKIFDYLKFRSMRDGVEPVISEMSAQKSQFTYGSQNSEIDFEKPCPKCSQLRPNITCSPLIHIGTESICEYWYSAQKNEINHTKSTPGKNESPRMTKVGKFIRNTGIDRLPQLINVLKGDMSIVGNRPLRLYEAEQLTKGDMSRRFLAPAGMTGLWQVEDRQRMRDISELERKSLDVAYSDHFIGNNYSFWYDFGILLRRFR